jgi:signal transduction histidine kinase
MTTSDPRASITESIESAIANLADALIDLEGLPVQDRPAVAAIAHALNHYLSVSDAGLALIEHAVRDHPNKEVATWLEALGHLGNMMHHTVGRLLHGSAPAHVPLKPDYVNVMVLMQRACDYYQPRAQARQLEITCQSVGDVPFAWADRVAVAVIADHLLSNAVKFSNPGGRIVVQILPGPGGVVTSVRDSGPGLTPLEQARLFQRGTVAPGTGKPSQGFGLSIAKEFVDRMGGRLWVESEPGRGACFFFRLPYHASEPPQSQDTQRDHGSRQQQRSTS